MINPTDEAREQLSMLVARAYDAAATAGELPQAVYEAPAAEVPKDSSNGDFSSTFALAMAKTLHTAPRKVAEVLLKYINLDGTYFDKIWIAGPGFLNVTLGSGWYGGVLASVEQAGMNFGALDIGRGKRVMVEFVSANPTGPMHLGNARGGVLGDSLAAVLERAGYDVWREFYVNDAGNQVELFGKSLYVRLVQHFRGEDAAEFPEDGYHGEDIRELAAEFALRHGEQVLEIPEEECRKQLIVFGLERNIIRMQQDLERYKVQYNRWFKESELHKSGYVDETVELLRAAGALYEKDGATWFRATDYGCEKDEVMIKSNGFYTYYAVDIAYHRNKFVERKFDMVIDALGADHHGHTRRFRAGMQAIGVEPSRLQFMLFQLVRLVRDGESVRMSKRTGKAITLSNLLDEISVDAARFFFDFRQPDTHLEFDIGLAEKEENDNPVFYVQYAHARICSLLRMLAGDGVPVPVAADIDAMLLCSDEEKKLIRAIAELPEEIRMAARDLDPSRLTRYCVDLAAAFHTFYNAQRIRGEAPELCKARLKLADITRLTLANVLEMLKITAPEHM